MVEPAGGTGRTSVRVGCLLAASAASIAEWCLLPRVLLAGAGNRTFAESTGLLLYATIPLPLWVVLLASRWALGRGPIRAGRCICAALVALAVCALPALRVALQR